MNKKAIELLEYNKIKDTLKSYTLSEQGKALIDKLEPSINIKEIEIWMRETTEAKAIMEKSSSVPIHSLQGISSIIGKLGKNGVLFPEEFSSIWDLLREGIRLKRFMADKEAVAPMVSSYALSIYDLKDIGDEIEKCIQNGRVDDRASAHLAKTRKKIVVLEDKIKSKIESIMRNSNLQQYLQDSVVSFKNGRYVIPVKSECRKYLSGEIQGSSASGSTVFIEPADVKKMHDELKMLVIEEENEVYRILSSLTAMVESCSREININIEVMANYDFLFAKGKYSRAIEGNPVELNIDKIIDINGGRHPLLGKSAVPLDFTIGRDYRALVITGPNTGGKTVTLKTVGLLTMMVQSGLHVPAHPSSKFSVFLDILVDIGDGQSIEQSLSTFSSHINNIVSILECADTNTLVIMDEIGAGTEPGEGSGLAISVLEEVYRKGAVILSTTHYNELKEFAGTREGFKNGCMEFDINTLKPLYKLHIGRAGESNAFLIALRLGMDRRIIERAHEITYNEKMEYSSIAFESVGKKNMDVEAVKLHERQVEKYNNTKIAEKKVEKQLIESPFKIGDCVYVSTLNRTGIVCELENSRGDVGVMYEKKKIKVNKKRLSLYIESKELYPDNYDFNIIFESVDNRKKRHQMEKRHVEGVAIELESGKEQ